MVRDNTILSSLEALKSAADAGVDIREDKLPQPFSTIGFTFENREGILSGLKLSGDAFERRRDRLLENKVKEVSGKVRIVIISGPSCGGKSYAVEELSDQFETTFIDSDIAHPQKNVDRMVQGKCLEDDMRAEWIRRFELIVAEGVKSADNVLFLACSALTAEIRERLSAFGKGVTGLDVLWIDCAPLDSEGFVDLGILRQRAEARDHEYIPNGSRDGFLSDQVRLHKAAGTYGFEKNNLLILDTAGEEEDAKKLVGSFLKEKIPAS